MLDNSGLERGALKPMPLFVAELCPSGDIPYFPLKPHIADNGGPPESDGPVNRPYGEQ